MNIKSLKVIGFTFGGAGYPYHTREFLFALDKLGYNIKIFELGQRYYTGLPYHKAQKHYQMLFKQYNDDKAPVLYSTLPCIGDHLINNTYHFIWTMLECTKCTKEWADFINYRTNILLTPDGFNKSLFINGGVKEDKIKILPLGIDLEDYNCDKHPLFNFKDRFMFMAMFEWLPRKNPIGLLQSYLEEFTNKDNVGLLLKTYNLSESVKKVISTMKNENSPPIFLIEQQIPESLLPNFYKSVDCYINLSHGEGWMNQGLQAMSMKVPIICGKFGGQSSYLNDDNSFLVDIEEIVDIPQYNIQTDSVYKGAKWAIHNQEQFKSYMREVYENGAEKKIKQALEDVKEYTWDNSAKIFDKIYQEEIYNFYNGYRPKCSNNNICIFVPTINKMCGVAEYSKNIKYPCVNNIEKAEKYGIINYQIEYSLFNYKHLYTQLREMKRQGKKLICTLHSFDEKLHEYNDVLREFDKIICHNNLMKKKMLDYGFKNVEVVNMPITKYSIKKKDIVPFRIGYMGFLFPHKGLKKLVDIVYRLKDKYPNIRLLAQATVHEDNPSSKDILDDFIEYIINKPIDVCFKPRKIKRILEDMSSCQAIILPYEDYANLYGSSLSIRDLMNCGRFIITSCSNFFSEFEREVLKTNNIEYILDKFLSDKCYPNYYIDNMNEYMNKYSWEYGNKEYKRILEC